MISNLVGNKKRPLKAGRQEIFSRIFRAGAGKNLDKIPMLVVPSPLQMAFLGLNSAWN
jgi:hypothetical protein